MAETISPSDDEDAIVDLDNGQRSCEDKRCPKCLEIRKRKPLIECAKCGSNYHQSCVGIKRAQAKVIGLFTCKSCRNVITPNHPSPNGPNQSNPDFNFLQHLQICKANLSLLGNIPRGARITAAEALTNSSTM